MFDRRELLKRTALAAGPLCLAGPAVRAFERDQEPQLTVHTEVPLNAEPPLDQLVASWITPNSSFYVRSHAPVPQLDPAQFSLSVEGLVDENLQPRARGALLMAIANARGALVLCPGNKAEIALGYNTLYGDTVGALAPIADLYKSDVYRLARSFGDRIPYRSSRSC